MYIDDLTDAVVACAEAKGWHVEAGIIYKEQKSEFEFGKYSPAGRDFSFSATMECANINSLIEDIDNYYEGFDGITVRDSVLTNIVLLMYFCGQKELWVTTGVCPQYIRTYGNAINITASMKG